MEICVDSVRSAIAASKGGAPRFELCSALSEGGLTPSIGQLKLIKQHTPADVFVMLRPRPGNFVYDEHDKECMKIDARLFKEHGADGYAFGALTEEGNVDIEFCKEMMDILQSRRVNFHRAFDWTCNPEEALEDIISLGFTRVLTSGQETTAVEGIKLITKLVQQAGDRIIIVPAGGITPTNVKHILTSTKAQEFHASARTSQKVIGIYTNPKCSMGTQDEVEQVVLSGKVKNLLQGYYGDPIM